MKKITRDNKFRSPLIFHEYLDWPNSLTLINIVVGGSALWLTLGGSYWSALALLWVATIIDHADGFVARRFYRSGTPRRAFGARIDTLADILNFTVVPVVLLAALVSGLTSLLVGLIYLVTGAIRLAHFDSSSDENDRQTTGIPTTYAGFIAGLALVLFLSKLIGSGMLLTIVASLGVAQVARIPIHFPSFLTAIISIILIAVAVLLLIAVVDPIAIR